MGISEKPQLTIEGGPNDGNSIAIGGEKLTLGRDDDNDIVIRGSGVSRRHAEILQGVRTYILRDLGSTNGTFVNGDTVTERPLGHGDVIRLGPSMVSLVFRTKGSSTVQMAAVQPYTAQAAPPKSNLPRVEKIEASAHILQYLGGRPEGATWDAIESDTGLTGMELTNAMARLIERDRVHQRNQVFFAGRGQDVVEKVPAGPAEHLCSEHGAPFQRYGQGHLVVYGHVVDGNWCAEESA